MKLRVLNKVSLGALLSFVVLACGLTFLGLFNKVSAEGPLTSNEHLVTIYDRGQERSVITERSHLREVFTDLGLVLDDNDIVEPGLDEALVGQSYQVNVYRARPVTIIDGDKRIPVMSAYQTPKQIAKQAGIVLHDEDKTALSLPQGQDILSSGASIQMAIDRAAEVTLVLYGKKERLYTQAATVAEFLKEKNITLGARDKLSVKQSTAIRAGMHLEIWRNGEQTQTREEPIAFTVRQVQDSNQPVGYRKVTTKGVAGKKAVTYRVTIKNGKAVARKVIQSVVIKKAVQQVETIGTKQENLGGSCGDWMKSAGINDTANATYLINAESGCDPYAVNPSSGACGVGQALPCSKTGCAMGDGYCQTKWMNQYVLGRYGSWQAAADHHRANNWY